MWRYSAPESIFLRWGKRSSWSHSRNTRHATAIGRSRSSLLRRRLSRGNKPCRYASFSLYFRGVPNSPYCYCPALTGP